MTLKICVAGATGWIGQPLCRAIGRDPELALVGAVARAAQGRRLSDVTGDAALDLIIQPSVAAALQTPTDILVDFTGAAAVRANVLAAIERGVHVVIGSSGLTEEDFRDIAQAAAEHQVGVIAAGNFAITALLLERFAAQAAKYLSQWEIIDYASDGKPDAPSGTARELAYRLSTVRQPESTIPIDATIGPKDSRGTTLNGSQVHSLRVPGFVISVEVIFGAAEERLSIRHDAGSGSQPYIQGTLLAIRKVRERIGLVRGLDRLLD